MRIVAITVDPQFDTSEVLAEYSERVGANDGEWMFLTGHRDSIYQLARKGFLLGVEDAAEVAEANPEEPILHSQRVVLVDAEGRIRGYYRGLSLEEMGRLAADAQTLAPESGRPAS